MNLGRDVIKKRLNNVFQEVFQDEIIEIFDEMSANDIEEWDSLRHIILVLAIEKEFGLQLNAAELGQLKNVGEMLDILEKRATR